MTYELKMPKPGMGITDCTIAKWLKSEGDRVTAGEPLAEFETAKALEELPSPVTGTLLKILAAEGDSVEVQSTIALIEEEGK